LIEARRSSQEENVAKVVGATSSEDFPTFMWDQQILLTLTE